MKLRPSDPALIFAGSTDSSTIGAIDRTLADGKPCTSCAPGATDLETALMRIAADPAAQGGPAVLVTDGWENRGDSSRAIGSIVAARIRLDIFTPPGATSIPNVDDDRACRCRPRWRRPSRSRSASRWKT